MNLYIRVNELGISIVVAIYGENVNQFVNGKC